MTQERNKCGSLLIFLPPFLLCTNRIQAWRMKRKSGDSKPEPSNQRGKSKETPFDEMTKPHASSLFMIHLNKTSWLFCHVERKEREKKTLSNEILYDFGLTKTAAQPLLPIRLTSDGLIFPAVLELFSQYSESRRRRQLLVPRQNVSCNSRGLGWQLGEKFLPQKLSLGTFLHRRRQECQLIWEADQFLLAFMHPEPFATFVPPSKLCEEESSADSRQSIGEKRAAKWETSFQAKDLRGAVHFSLHQLA